MTLDERLDFMREAIGIVNPPYVKGICEGYAQMSTENGDKAIDIIQASLPFIFDFDFPIADDTHRQELETKIIKNYYFRQICCQDVEEWKLRLSNKLMLIMPYYNELYASLDYLKGNILDDVDYERKVEEGSSKNGLESSKTTQNTDTESHNELTGQDATTNSTTKKGVGRYSDTPQSQIEALENNDYLTNATISDETSSSNDSNISSKHSESTGSSDVTGTFDTLRSDSGTRDMTEHVKGKMGMKTKASMVMEYRKAIINIDNEIVSRLSDLFLNIYTTWG